MRFQTHGLVIALLALGIFGLPASPLHDLFTNPSIPVISELNPSVFNLTTAIQNNDARMGKRAISLPYILYSVTMDGRNVGNFQDFVVSGQILITQGIPSSGTRNEPNPFDVLITIGHPATNPIAGSIQYTTNRYLYKFINGNSAESLIDYAFVTNAGNSIGVTVDTSIAAANQLSNFNARSGLTANAYIITSGGFSVMLSGTALSGSINVAGSGYILGGSAPYKAVMSGAIVGRGTVTI